MSKQWTHTKNWLKWSAPLGLAVVLAACGGKNDNNAGAAESGATASAIASASPSATEPSASSPGASPSGSEAAASPDAAVQPGYLLYEDAESGVSMQYPED